MGSGSKPTESGGRRTTIKSRRQSIKQTCVQRSNSKSAVASRSNNKNQTSNERYVQRRAESEPEDNESDKDSHLICMSAPRLTTERVSRVSQVAKLDTPKLKDLSVSSGIKQVKKRKTENEIETSDSVVEDGGKTTKKKSKRIISEECTTEDGKIKDIQGEKDATKETAEDRLAVKETVYVKTKTGDKKSRKTITPTTPPSSVRIVHRGLSDESSASVYVQISSASLDSPSGDHLEKQLSESPTKTETKTVTIDVAEKREKRIRK